MQKQLYFHHLVSFLHLGLPSNLKISLPQALKKVDNHSARNINTFFLIYHLKKFNSRLIHRMSRLIWT